MKANLEKKMGYFAEIIYIVTLRICSMFLTGLAYIFYDFACFTPKIDAFLDKAIFAAKALASIAYRVGRFAFDKATVFYNYTRRYLTEFLRRSYIYFRTWEKRSFAFRMQLVEENKASIYLPYNVTE